MIKYLKMSESRNKFFYKIYKKLMKTVMTPDTREWLTKENDYLRTTIKKNSIVLDVGCGFGRTIMEIADLCKLVVGIDHNKIIFDEAKRELSNLKNVELYLEDGSKMHFKNNFFDYSINMGNTLGIIHEKKLAVLREMKRVTKNGGKIILSVYSENALDDRLTDYKNVGLTIERVEGGTVYTKEHYVTEQFTRERLEKLFKLAGLKVKIFDLNPISYICEAVV